MGSTGSALVRQFIELAFNEGNLDILDGIVHPDYRFRSPDNELNGLVELRRLIIDFRQGFPDLYLEIDEQMEEGNKVMTCFTLTGTHQSEFMGIPATRQSVKVCGMVVSRFRNNRIVEEWELLDQLSLLTQLGVISAQQEAGPGTDCSERNPPSQLGSLGQV